MRFTSKQELVDLLRFVEHQTVFVLESTIEIKTPKDFMLSMNGIVLFNSTCMCLQSIGEAIRKVDNKTEGKLFAFYPETPWKQIIGMRNIISHEYLSIDHDLIFDIVKEELPPLLTTLHRLLTNTDAGIHDEIFDSTH